MKKKLELIKDTIILSRPLHWIKNLALFAALVFNGSLLNNLLFNKVIIAFVSFSLATSCVYVFNDLLDAKHDRLHPIKKNRPIAAKKISQRYALFYSICLLIISLAIAKHLNQLFYITVIVYLALQFLYSALLKHMATIDILIIASGFVLRVFAGAFVVNAHLSVWFLLCVISVSLYLASGKRRAELNITKNSKGSTRKSLNKYTKELLNSYVTMFGNAAWMSWALFSFYESPRAPLPVWLLLAEISKTTTVDKLLMSTIPVVIFGIMRYQNLIFQDRSEAPEKLFLTDKSLVISILIWTFMVYWIIYNGHFVLI